MTEMFESEIVFSCNASDSREGRYGLSGVAAMWQSEEKRVALEVFSGPAGEQQLVEKHWNSWLTTAWVAALSGIWNN